MRRVSAKFVPRLLTENQQFQRLATSSDLFQSESDDPEFMKLIITGDESGLTDMIPKQCSSRHTGKPPVLLGKRKPAGAIKNQSHVDCVFRCSWNCSS
ncbi:hypothetical protein TNCV_2668321 [Trichonephila clavipes]|nr:hypothetical protein TNCV_2668321 [Trichonephila clavipes]